MYLFLHPLDLFRLPQYRTVLLTQVFVLLFDGLVELGDALLEVDLPNGKEITAALFAAGVGIRSVCQPIFYT